jgi:uncharacterized protein (TIGR03437 family)
VHPPAGIWILEPGPRLVYTRRLAVAQHSSDFSPVTKANPARPGEIVILYANGLGLVQPAVSPGAPAPTMPLATTVLNPEVTIGGTQAEVLFSGLAPGFVNLYQLNVRVPESAQPGDQDVIIDVQTFLQGPQLSNTAKLPVS